jgi:hypothetical protein
MLAESIWDDDDSADDEPSAPLASSFYSRTITSRITPRR